MEVSVTRWVGLQPVIYPSGKRHRIQHSDTRQGSNQDQLIRSLANYPLVHRAQACLKMVGLIGKLTLLPGTTFLLNSPPTLPCPCDALVDYEIKCYVLNTLQKPNLYRKKSNVNIVRNVSSNYNITIIP